MEGSVIINVAVKGHYSFGQSSFFVTVGIICPPI